MKTPLSSFIFPLTLLASATFLSGCAGSSAGARSIPVSESEAIFVSGEGEAEARPDRVRLSLGVEAKSERLDDAMADATTRMTALKKALLALGVKEENMRTGQFSFGQVREPIIVTVTEPTAVPVSPKSSGGKSAGLPAEVSAVRTEERWVERYVVQNSLDVTYDEIPRAGALVTAAVAAGANTSFGITFEVKEMAPLEETARKAAMEDAERRAKQIAAVAGVKVGRVLSVNDGGGGGHGPYPMYQAKADTMEAMPIEGGTSKIRRSVQVAYAIER